MTKPARIILLVLSGVLLTGWLLSRHPAKPIQFRPSNSTNEVPHNEVPTSPFPRRPPAPNRPITTDKPTTNSTNLVERMLNGDFPQLTLEQVSDYLRNNDRNIDSLLGAFAATGDRSLLHEAMERFPNDPRVAMAAYFRISPEDMTPEERSRWLATWRQADPGNSLPSFMTALEQLKAGQLDAARDAMQVAATGSFNDNVLDSIQNAEEAWRSTGVSEVEAKTISHSETVLPSLAPLKQLGVQLVDLAQTYENAGDPTTANELRRSALGLSLQLENAPGTTLITELVGMAVERKALDGLPPNSLYDEAGTTVQDRIDQLTGRRAEIRDLAGQTTELFSRMSDQDRISYADRMRTFGELAAMRWAVEKLQKP
jgi:hypothetical protein